MKKIYFSIIFLITISILYAIPQGEGKNDRFKISHKDMQGIVLSGSGGGTLGTLAIRDTGVSIPSFQDANDDIAVGNFQMQHDKKLGINLDSVHLHYYLPNAPSAGNVVYFDYAYKWYNAIETIPAISGWTIGRSTMTFTGAEAQYSTGYFSVVSNITPPTNESYSSILKIKITRDSTGLGSDTYASDLGIDYIDLHYIADRVGSYNESTD